MLKVKDYLRTALVCVVIAFACLFGYLMFQNLCAELFIRWGLETRQTDSDLFTHGFFMALVFVGVFVPILEELIFRLVACNLLKLAKMPDWCVIIISAVVFMLYHGSWSQTVYQLLMGIWFAWIFLKTKQIGWTILIHAINNTFIVTYTYFAGEGSGVFNLSTGNICWSISLAIVTTLAVVFLIKKGIYKYEK